jgi:hypothetical protein
MHRFRHHRLTEDFYRHYNRNCCYRLLQGNQPVAAAKRPFFGRWVQGSRFKVQGSRFKVQGSRFKVQGSRNDYNFRWISSAQILSAFSLLSSVVHLLSSAFSFELSASYQAFTAREKPYAFALCLHPGNNFPDVNLL